MRILVAEDSAANLVLVRAYLKDPMFEIHTASNGAAAVEKFQSGAFDLVLMDIQMPIMDGYTATRNIRQWEANQHRRPVPILALTAHASREEEHGSFAAGCNAHLIKPIHKAELLEAILKYAAPATDEKIRITPPAGIEEAVPLFLESTRDDLRALASALAEGDYSKARFIGHDWKGTGGGYGFDQISVVGKAIEEAAKRSDRDEISRQMAALEDYLDRVEVIYD